MTKIPTDRVTAVVGASLKFDLPDSIKIKAGSRGRTFIIARLIIAGNMSLLVMQAI